MKVSRIYPYTKTKGERYHEEQVKYARVNEFKHPGSKSGRILHAIVKHNLTAQKYNTLNFLRRMF